MNWVYCLRMLNVLLAGGVAGLCFLKTSFDYKYRARNARIAGLGLLCVTLALGFFATRHDVFNYRAPMYTVALLVCLYGMRRTAAGEEDRAHPNQSPKK